MLLYKNIFIVIIKSNISINQSQKYDFFICVFVQIAQKDSRRTPLTTPIKPFKPFIYKGFKLYTNCTKKTPVGHQADTLGHQRTPLKAFIYKGQRIFNKQAVGQHQTLKTDTPKTRQGHQKPLFIRVCDQLTDTNGHKN